MHHPGDEIRLTLMRGGQPVAATVVLQQRAVPVADVPPSELVKWLIRPSQRTSPVVGPSGFSASYEDDRHVLILTIDERGKYLLAKDKQDRTLFAGLVNPGEERKGVPQQIYAKLQRLEILPKPTSKVIFPKLPQPNAPPPTNSPRPSSF